MSSARQRLFAVLGAIPVVGAFIAVTAQVTTVNNAIVLNKSIGAVSQ